jgi:hypothetical protein
VRCSPQARDRAALVAAHQARVADHISRDDRCQPTLLSCRQWFPQGLRIVGPTLTGGNGRGSAIRSELSLENLTSRSSSECRCPVGHWGGGPGGGSRGERIGGIGLGLEPGGGSRGASLGGRGIRAIFKPFGPAPQPWSSLGLWHPEREEGDYILPTPRTIRPVEMSRACNQIDICSLSNVPDLLSGQQPIRLDAPYMGGCDLVTHT